MSNRKVIEETADYTIFEDEFEGKPIIYRYWHNDPTGVDIKFTDAFAQANGYTSAGDMIAQTIGEQGRQVFIAVCGYFPEWVRFNSNGQFCVVAKQLQVIGEA